MPDAGGAVVADVPAVGAGVPVQADNIIVRASNNATTESTDVFFDLIVIPLFQIYIIHGIAEYNDVWFALSLHRANH